MVDDEGFGAGSLGEEEFGVLAEIIPDPPPPSRLYPLSMLPGWGKGPYGWTPWGADLAVIVPPQPKVPCEEFDLFCFGTCTAMTTAKQYEGVFTSGSVEPDEQTGTMVMKTV